MEVLVARVRALASRASAVGVSTHASSFAYFAFLSVVPLLSLCIALVSVVGVREEDVLSFFTYLVPETLEGIVSALVNDAFGRADLALSVSTLTLLWSASKGVRSLMDGLNAVNGVKETRGLIHVSVLSVVAAVVLGALVASVMYLIFGGGVQEALSHYVPGLKVRGGLMVALDALATFLCAVLVLTLCYTYLPAGKRRIASQVPAAAVASVSIASLSYGYGVYVDNFANVNVLYGSIATVALLLVWIYLVACILLFCALVFSPAPVRGGSPR